MQKVWHLFANGVDQALLTLLVAYSCLANVSLQPALRYEFGQGSLVDTRGSPAHRHSRSGKHVEKWIGKNCVADSECRNQRLADRPDVNDAAVWVETLQSRQWSAKVTVFAEVVIFQNPRVHPMGKVNQLQAARKTHGHAQWALVRGRDVHKPRSQTPLDQSGNHKSFLVNLNRRDTSAGAEKRRAGEGIPWILDSYYVSNIQQNLTTEAECMLRP